MGWATYVDAEIYFNRETFNHTEEVEDRINGNKRIMDMVMNKLMILAAMDPSLKKEKYDDGDTSEDVPLEDTIYCDVSNLMKSYDEALIENYRLNLLLENWDKRQGDFVDNPNMKQDDNDDE